MSMKSFLSLFLFCLYFLVACRSTKVPKTRVRTIDTFTVSAYNNPMQQYRASATQYWLMQHTRVALSFDYARREAVGEAWLTLQPYFYPTDSVVLDAKSMQIHDVTLAKEQKKLDYSYDGTTLKIKLGRRYTQLEQLNLHIRYTAQPYALSAGGSAAITQDRGLYFINHNGAVPGKPVQIWTQGETESNSHWMPCIDKPNSRTKFQLELTVPAQYQTLSNGRLLRSVQKDSLRTDFWASESSIQIYALMFAVGEFAVAREDWNGKDVNYYVEPAYAPYARMMFQHTPEMLTFFSNITGVPYPWEKYSQIVVRDYVSGAMENTSASLFGSFMNQNAREYADGNHEDVVVHELFHQWFGDYVTAESWSHLTVNESFATYGEYLWRKYKYGKFYADQLAYADLMKYLDYSDYADPVLVRHYYRDKEDMFDRVSYQKGGAILRYLHSLMGDEAFYRAMNLYLSKNAFQSAEATHWRLAVEEATGQDWSWFFDLWYYRAGHPSLNISYQYDDQAAQLKVKVQQVQKNGLYRLPLQCGLIVGNELLPIHWDINKAQHSFVYPYQNGQRPVLVPDIEHVLPGTITENKNAQAYLKQLLYTNDYISKLKSIQSVQVKSMSDSATIAIIDAGLHDPSAAIREATMQQIVGLNIASLRKKWTPDILMMAQNEGNVDAKATAVALIGAWNLQGQEDLLEGLIVDSSYMVAANALRSLSLLNNQKAYVHARNRSLDFANTPLDNNAWAILCSQAKDADTALLRQIVVDVPDSKRRNQLRDYLLVFAQNTKNEVVFEQCLQWIELWSTDKHNLAQRSEYYGAWSSLIDYLSEKLKRDARNQVGQKRLALVKNMIASIAQGEQDADLKNKYQELLK